MDSVTLFTFFALHLILLEVVQVLLDQDASFHAVHDRHADVEDDGRVEGLWLTFDHVHGLEAVFRQINVVEVLFQPLREGLKKELVVVRQQAVTLRQVFNVFDRRKRLVRELILPFPVRTILMLTFTFNRRFLR